MFGQLIHILNLIRIKQWIKNIFVFIPMFFGKELFVSGNFYHAMIAFFSFSFMSSAVYCMNDIRDVEYDKNHPVKKNRPLASGAMPIKVGYLTGIVMFLCSIVLAFYLGVADFSVLISTYFLVNIGYSFLFKNVIYVDVVIISLGFLIRLWAGAVVTNIELSNWIIFLVFLLTMFLGLGKRKGELLLLQNFNKKSRLNMGKYSINTINILLRTLIVIITLIYTLYTIHPNIKFYNGDYYAVFTIFPVFLGLLRYYKLIDLNQDYGNPTKIIWRDRVIQILLMIWFISFYFILY